MPKPQKCFCDQDDCKTCKSRKQKHIWRENHPERAAALQREATDKWRSIHAASETERNNAAKRFIETQQKKATQLRKEFGEGTLEGFKRQMEAYELAIAEGAITLAEWIETDWRPNLPDNHKGKRQEQTT